MRLEKVQLRPLEGIKILDFTHVLAGPFCTRLLADMGADVVKVNSESRMQINAPAGPYFTMWNRNKRTISLDMNHEPARKVAGQLAQMADVVIDNFSMGVLDRWGIGFDDVSQVNGKVIYVQMSGMGSGGPWSNFVTYAPTIHALAGLTYTTGVSGRENIGLGFSYNDHQAGLHAAVAVLSAVEARRHSGKGQRIDISQFEVAVNLLGPTFMHYFRNDQPTEPSGNDLQYDRIAPHGCYRCKDSAVDGEVSERWIAIACLDDAHWNSLCDAMNRPDWTKDLQLETAEGRYVQRRYVDEQIGKWTSEFDPLILMEELQGMGVPAGVVQDGRDLMENDPQLQESKFIRTIEEPHPRMGEIYADKLPIEFESTSCEIYKRARLLGEDNESILSDWLGIDKETVQKGEEDGYFR
ncbi:MAG: CoA transferase [Gammaproteobacteria bacterium]|nr:CoA transferase [Gammaproteobacteria bacterium]MYD79026.1 CoA transferase [Gammaproteobacteria bacterium]